MDFILRLKNAVDDNSPRCVVRIITSSWNDRRGIHIKRSLNYLRRKSEGFNFLEEDAAQIGAVDVFPRIINFNKCPDGIYQIIPCDEKTDWETGYVEDWNYKLIPYDPTGNSHSHHANQVLQEIDDG